MMSALLRKFLGRVDFYSGVLTQDYRRRAFKDYNTFILFRNMLRPYMGNIKGKFICARARMTPKILDELSEYSIDELLTSTITIVARKRS
jgi:hypothetical protein